MPTLAPYLGPCSSRPEHGLAGARRHRAPLPTGAVSRSELRVRRQLRSLGPVGDVDARLPDPQRAQDHAPHVGGVMGDHPRTHLLAQLKSSSRRGGVETVERRVEAGTGEIHPPHVHHPDVARDASLTIRVAGPPVVMPAVRTTAPPAARTLPAARWAIRPTRCLWESTAPRWTRRDASGRRSPQPSRASRSFVVVGTPGATPRAAPSSSGVLRRPQAPSGVLRRPQAPQ